LVLSGRVNMGVRIGNLGVKCNLEFNEVVFVKKKGGGLKFHEIIFYYVI